MIRQITDRKIESLNQSPLHVLASYSWKRNSSSPERCKQEPKLSPKGDADAYTWRKRTDGALLDRSF